MNRIRTWIIHAIFGPAKSEPPGDGQMRLNWEEIHADMKRGFEASQTAISISPAPEQDAIATEPAKELIMNTSIEAGDLNTGHLGKIVTVTRDETTVTGMLTSIKHIADLIDDSRQFDVLPSFVLGRSTTTADIMHAGRIELDSNSEVTVGA